MEELRLHSPVGAGREFDLVYVWPTDDNEKYSEEDLAEEIRDSISAVLPDHPGLAFRIPPIKALKTYEQLQDLCHKWNSTVDNYIVGKTFVENKASLPQAQHIIGQVYNKSVVCPERLNQYTAFSSHVYGETSPKMVSHMIKQLQITEDDIFLDLGSGVGQVVLQMAAAANFKLCIGIETCEVPCEYAVGLEQEFHKTMKWYGKYYSKFHLYKGDFLEKPYREVILKSTIIFANNFAFGPEVDHHLKEIFADLDDGVRIVSSKEFSAINFRINQRNLSDIGTIMNVSAMKPFEGAVSWTNSKVCFFMHVIDRTKLARWFEDGKQQSGKQQHNLAVEKPKRKPPKINEDKPPRKKPRAKFVMKKKKKDRNEDIGRIRRNSDEGSSDFDGHPPVLYPELDVPVKLEPQNVVRPETFKVPLQPILQPNKTKQPQSTKAPSNPTRKRKPGNDVKAAPHNPSLVDLNRVSSQERAVVSSQTPVDEYADAPWRNVVITPGPPKSVDELLARMRVQYFQMLDTMTTRSYAQQLLADIEVEKERNAALKSQKAREMKVINIALKIGEEHLIARLAELGIEKEDWETLSDVMQESVHEHTMLSMQKSSLIREINSLEQQGERLRKYRLLCDIHEQIKMKQSLRKSLSKVTCELHEIEGKTPPSFPDSPNSDCEFSGETHP
uniref:Histone-lysine N-methyltransferase, H3 lysine-79 specific n=1 Tax=Lygus hesperus TaxID=30085 RepID=A0A0A9XZ65_LYGHE